ncbi:MAG: RIP metalloprotease RseP [Bacteroidetes bacterium]|nr:RIP metalloprotease RseP [Bacteroidota bacterium]MBU2507412.1 RIP metalloprotease RseP [Bacteroidota bacterium]
MDYIIYFILTIAILVFFHELGHFLAAKMCGMQTDIFAIGFGKRLFGWNRINGFSFGELEENFDLQGHTDYRLGIIPLGGYVKIVGMIDESLDTKFVETEPKPHEFRSKPTYQKLFVITAGVMMNITLTLVIFSGINFFQGKQVLKTALVGEVKEGTIVHDAGFRSYDKILEIDNVPVDNWEDILNKLLIENFGQFKSVKVLRDNADYNFDISIDLTTEAARQNFYLPPGEIRTVISEVFTESPAEISGIKAKDVFLSINNIPQANRSQTMEIISSSKSTPIDVKLLRGNDTVYTNVTPSVEGKIGIMLGDAYTGEIEYRSYSFFESVSKGVTDIFDYTVFTFSSLKTVIAGDVEFGAVMGGPVKIAQLAADTADLGLIAFLRFLAFISLSLAIVNILPFPVLDGGHFVIIVIEGIIRKELPIKFKIAIQNMGFIILLILMVFIIYNDIINL